MNAIDRTKRGIRRTLKQQHPDYSEGTIAIMVAFQLGGWDAVDALLAERFTHHTGRQ